MNKEQLKKEFGDLAVSLSDEMKTAISNWWICKMDIELDRLRNKMHEYEV